MTNNVLTFTGGKAEAMASESMDSRVEYLNTILAGTGVEFEAPPKPKPPSLAYGYSFLVIMAVLGAIAGHWLSSL